MINGTHIKRVGGAKALQFQFGPGIYFLTLVGIVVYVGQSTNVMRRIQEHLDEGTKHFDGAFYRPCPIEKLDETEALFIHSLEPQYNYTMANGKKFSPVDRDVCLNAAAILIKHQVSDKPAQATDRKHNPSPPISHTPPASHDGASGGALRLLRLPDVLQRTGLGKTSLYQFMRDGKFPAGRKLGLRSVVWSSHEIEQWCASKFTSEPA